MRTKKDDGEPWNRKPQAKLGYPNASNRSHRCHHGNKRHNHRNFETERHQEATMRKLDMQSAEFLGLTDEAVRRTDRMTRRLEETPVMVNGQVCVELSFRVTVPLPEGPLPEPEAHGQQSIEAWHRVRAELPKLISWMSLEALKDCEEIPPSGENLLEPNALDRVQLM